MSKLVFDEVNTEAVNFIQNGSRHCPKPVAGQLI